jgi:hypothetical protein
MKILIGLGFVAILAALASAGVFMLRRPPEGASTPPSGRMARALAVRVGVSIAVFLLILLGYAMGWIHPTGVPLGR